MVDGTTGDPRTDVRGTLRDLREWAGTGEVRVDVAVAVVDALERRLDGESRTALYQIARSIVTTGDNLLGVVDDLITVRDAIQRRLVQSLESAVALELVGQLNVLIDDLLRDTADRSVRALSADAYIDPLTGAGNRRAFERDAQRAIDLARRNNREVALAAIDLDGLKRLNDTEGHAAGDRALRMLASAVLGELRAGDGFYRIGGDEFAVLLPEGSNGGLDALIARARVHSPSFSYGTSAYPADGTTLPELVRIADTRMLAGRQQRGRPVPPRAAPRRLVHDVAGAVPIVVAVLAVELFRRAIGVQLQDALRSMWVGMMALALVLGIPASRRFCDQHAKVRDTARCALPIATVVLLVMSTALLPVHRIGNALEAAALQRAADLAGPQTVGLAQSTPTRRPPDNVILSPNDEAVALPAPPPLAPVVVHATTSSSPVAFVAPVALDTPVSGKLVAAPSETTPASSSAFTPETIPSSSQSSSTASDDETKWRRDGDHRNGHPTGQHHHGPENGHAQGPPPAHR